MIDEKVMERLKEEVGKKVRVDCVWDGRPYTIEGVLKEVINFVNIEIEIVGGGVGIPFVGYGSAIRKITGENGTLYGNPLIPIDYDLREDKEVDIIVAQSFGDEVAAERRQKQEAARTEWLHKVVQLNKEAQTKTIVFQEIGRELVKPGLEEEWNEHVFNNTKGFYSAGVIEASLRVMRALSQGKSPKEAESTVDGMGITGFQMGCVARTVSYFHPRGEEFRQYWNRQYLSEEEAKSTKGVINPAIFTLSL